MFRLAQQADRPSIVSLWQEAFGSAEEAEGFLDRFPQCLSFVAQDGAAMVHALPQVLWPDRPAAYLYAIATRRQRRGQGLCRSLMAFAETELRRRGFACCVLCPAEPSLFSFYAAMGYEPAFTRKHTAFPGGTPISLEEYLRRRERLLTVPHMVCTRELLSYAEGLYGLRFYETAAGIAAASADFTAEVLPQDLAGEPCAMIKWLAEPAPLQDAYLGFSLE